jgi:hypothetical protein
LTSEKLLPSASLFPAGIRHSVRVMSAFCTVRSAYLPSILVAVRPGVPFSTTNVFTASSSSSRAKTTTRSAKVPLPIQRLAPLSTHSSPSRRAVVSSPRATSEPPCGSVSAKQPIVFSSIMSGSQRRFCSSEPRITTEPMARPLCTPRKVAMDGSTRAASSEMNPVNSREARGEPAVS